MNLDLNPVAVTFELAWVIGVMAGAAMWIVLLIRDMAADRRAAHEAESTRDPMVRSNEWDSTEEEVGALREVLRKVYADEARARTEARTQPEPPDDPFGDETIGTRKPIAVRYRGTAPVTPLAQQVVQHNLVRLDQQARHANVITANGPVREFTREFDEFVAATTGAPPAGRGPREADLPVRRIVWQPGMQWPGVADAVWCQDELPLEVG